MENILILNFDGPESLFSLGRFIKNISINNPDSKVGLLVLDRDLDAAGLIPGIEELFYIRSNDIKEYLKRELFSDALAVDILMDTILKIEEKSWDKIIHFGSSDLGKYLSSYFTNIYPRASFVGYRYNELKTTSPRDKWHILSNALSPYPFNPLNDLEIFHLSLEIPFTQPNRILNENNHDIKVGIQIPSSTDDNNLPFKTLIELIDVLKTDLNYFPILLFDPADSNEEYAGKINRYFDNELEIINTNYLNLTKILPLLDRIITSKSTLKNLAQQSGIPVIEIMVGEESLKNNWAPGKKDLTLLNSERIRGEDIYNALTHQFDLIGDEVKIFNSHPDLIGSRPFQIKGPRNPLKDISSLMARYLIGKLYLNMADPEILSEISSRFEKELPDWQIREKEVICKVSRIILNSLRLLKQVTEKNENVAEFIESIDELLTHAKSNKLVAIPILLFKYQTDLIPLDTNLESFEKLIFNLKEGIQSVVLALKDIENAIWNMKKRTLIQKSLKNKTTNLSN